MPTIIQDFYEEPTNEIGNLKTDRDKDQVIIIKLSKIIHCLIYGVYNKNIDRDFVNKVEVIKQLKQSRMNSETVDFFASVIQKLQR